jgi:hypothetical protein
MAAKTATMIHDDWLPNVGAETWNRVHQHFIEFQAIVLFGMRFGACKDTLQERCTCLSDDEISHFDKPHEQCIRCELRTSSVHRRRMNTAYENDDSNFTVQCDYCFEESEKDWADMWHEYHSGCI